MIGSVQASGGIRQRHKGSESDKGVASAADPEVERPAVHRAAMPATADGSVAASPASPVVLAETRKRRSSLMKLKNYIWLEVFGAQEYYEKEEVRQ